MSKRRSQGEGSVSQEPNGRWVARIELPRGPNGKRRRRLRRAATKRQAIEHLRQMQTELEQAERAKSDRTLTQTMREYLESVRAASPASTQTLENDHRWYRMIAPLYGDRMTSEITVQEFDHLLQQIADGDLPGQRGGSVSRDYVNRARSFLTKSLNNDIRLGHLTNNNANLAITPATEGRTYPRRSLTATEWSSLFNAAKQIPKLVVDLGGRHGLRPQEVRSLRWEGIDLTQRTLTVLNQFDSFDEFVDPKTTRSHRTIRLHHETIALLEHRGQQITTDKEANPTRYLDRDLVISTRYGTAVNKDNLNRSLESACNTSGIPRITSYELRHTAITHQIEAGKNVSQVADWAGTSEQMIYKHYRHKIREIIDLDPVNHSEPNH